MKSCLQVLGLIFRKVIMGTYFKYEMARVRYFLHGCKGHMTSRYGLTKMQPNQ